MTERRRFPWLKVGLAVSLALNVLIVGLVIGAVSHAQKGPDIARPPSGGNAFRLISMLPPEARSDVRLEIQRLLSAEPQVARISSRGGDSFLQVLQRRNVTEAEILQSLTERRQMRDALVATADKALAQEISQMSYEDRKDYAKRLKRAARKHRTGDHDRSKH